MVEILNFIFRDFWTWLGVVILIGLPLQFIVKMYNRTLRYWNIRKHGYPANCDAAGDFKKEKDSDND